MYVRFVSYLFFFFNDTATTEIYTLSLHDALPISVGLALLAAPGTPALVIGTILGFGLGWSWPGLMQFAVVRLNRSEEHTSELQSRQYLVCRLLLEKKKNNT